MAYTPSEHFKAAAEYLSSSYSLAKVSNDVKLELYALFKCITTSKTPSNPRPSLFDFAGRAKWDAWNALGSQDVGNHPHVLEERYIVIAQSFGWKAGVQTVSFENYEADSQSDEPGNSSRGGGVIGAAVSAMVQPPLDPKDEGTVHAFALSNDAEGLLSFLNAKPDTDVNLRDDYGYTPLHLAADRGHVNVVKVLMANGADASIRDSEEFTACALAEVGGHQEVIELLQGRSPH